MKLKKEETLLELIKKIKEQHPRLTTRQATEEAVKMLTGKSKLKLKEKK